MRLLTVRAYPVHSPMLQVKTQWQTLTGHRSVSDYRLKPSLPVWWRPWPAQRLDSALWPGLWGHVATTSTTCRVSIWVDNVVMVFSNEA